MRNSHLLQCVPPLRGRTYCCTRASVAPSPGGTIDGLPHLEATTTELPDGQVADTFATGSSSCNLRKAVHRHASSDTVDAME